MPHHASLRNTCLALAGCLALGVAGLTAPVPAWGQASGMGGIGASQTITARDKVQAIDLATREVTLVGPEGNVFTVHAGDAVRNLDKVKVGDTVVATYDASIALVLSAAGTQVPDNQVNAALARAAKGQLPAGVLGTKVVVTGTCGRCRSHEPYDFAGKSVGRYGAYLRRYRSPPAGSAETGQSGQLVDRHRNGGLRDRARTGLTTSMPIA